MAEQWPRLSVDLPHRFAGPAHCMSCGTSAEPRTLQRWQECDARDRREPILVILCPRCADQLIEPHPRLYRPVGANVPWPGAMELCLPCPYRDGLTCRHPDLKSNGGEGLELIHPQPQRMHVYYGGGRGEWITFYDGPVRHCAGREMTEEVPHALV